MDKTPSPYILSPFARGEEEEKYTGQWGAMSAHSESETGLYYYNAQWRGAALQRSVPGGFRRCSAHPVKCRPTFYCIILLRLISNPNK